MLPNFEDRMALGFTSQRYWDIMIQSRYPGDPSLQLIENQALAKKALNWIETRRFVSMVTYDKSGFVFITLDLETEATKKAHDILEFGSKISFNHTNYVNGDSIHYPNFTNPSCSTTKFRINNKKVTIEIAMKNIFTEFPLIDRVTLIRWKNLQPKNERNSKPGNVVYTLKCGLCSSSVTIITVTIPRKHDSTIDELEELKNMFENLKDIVEISIDYRYLEIQGKENMLGRLGEGLKLLSANMVNLNDSQIQEILSKCRSLQSLNMRDLRLTALNLSQVTKQQLIELIENDDIEILDFVANKVLITYDVLDYIAHKSKNIKSLGLRGNKKITIVGLDTILSELRGNLIHLDLTEYKI